jgi:hypothetical protein
MSDTKEGKTEPSITDFGRLEKEKDDRQLRFWVIKAITCTFMFVVGTVVTAMLYTFVVRGDDLQENVLGSIFETVREIIKLMIQM